MYLFFRQSDSKDGGREAARSAWPSQGRERIFLFTKIATPDRVQVGGLEKYVVSTKVLAEAKCFYLCLYCTKLELILNRTPTTRRARGDAILLRTHWSLTPRPRLRYRSGGRTPKISLPFFAAPPQTPPPRSGKQKGKEILGCDGAVNKVKKLLK